MNYNKAPKIHPNQSVYSTNTKLHIQLCDARNEREKIFHAPETGLIDIGRQSKNYLKSILGLLTTTRAIHWNSIEGSFNWNWVDKN